MHINYDTWLNKGDLVYRIRYSKIETWRVRGLEFTAKDILDKDTQYSVAYWIEAVDCNYSSDMCFSQERLQEEFYTSKKLLIEDLMKQL